MNFLWPCCDFLPCLPQSEKQNVKMMNQNGLFRIGFVDELKVQILELPYTKGKLDMVVLLPGGSVDNLKALEEVRLHLHISAAAVHGVANSRTQLSD